MITNAPQFINWNYSHICNFDCRHCYSRNPKTLFELNTDEMLIACENFAKSGVFQVNLGGGEPVVRPDCDDAIRYLSNHGVRVLLSSNGWLLSRKRLYALQVAGLKQVNVSLDHSVDKEHDISRGKPGSFERAILAIRVGAELGLEMHISTVLASNNWNAIEAIAQLGEKNGATGLNLKRFRTVRHLRSLEPVLSLSQTQVNCIMSTVAKLKQNKTLRISMSYQQNPVGDIDNGCSCGLTSLAVRPNGTIAPCVYSDIEIGNVLNDSVRQVWKNSTYLQEMRKRYVCLSE